MKKLFVIAAIFAATLVGATSCVSKDTERCWQVVSTQTDGNVSATVTTYIWASENQIDATIKDAEAEAKAEGATVSFTKKAMSKYKTQADCIAQNIDL